MNTKFDDADMMLVEMVIESPGFKLIEERIAKEKVALDTVLNLTDNLFANGVLKGEVTGITKTLWLFAEIRRQLKEVRQKGEHDG